MNALLVESTRLYFQCVYFFMSFLLFFQQNWGEAQGKRKERERGGGRNKPAGHISRFLRMNPKAFSCTCIDMSIHVPIDLSFHEERSKNSRCDTVARRFEHAQVHTLKVALRRGVDSVSDFA